MTEAREAVALKQRHADLDRQLELEQARPLPDDGVLADLKRQKLALKDQLQDA
ncbi:MAG: YdcH family protein [Proteobacteria bacterium]|nr:YdcH family protein [Pseudomonadota bacterium]MDA1309218.1 YdcH family protein [Pseudomonadota bacterium]